MPRISARAKTLMSSSTAPGVPAVVDVSVDDYSASSFSSPPPINKIKTPLSPLYRGGGSESPTDVMLLTQEECLGISPPLYQEVEDQHNFGASDEDNSIDSDDSRIGITPSKYEKPEMPTSPQDLFFQKKLKEFKREQTRFGGGSSGFGGSPPVTPHHVYFGDSDSCSSSVQTGEARRIAGPPALPENDGIKRYLHPQTARGQFLVNSTHSVTLPEEGSRYNLRKQRMEYCKPLLIPDHHSDGMSVHSSSTTSLSSSVQSCPTPYKIFCLLLNPRAKIFELIHIIYSPDVTTISDLIAMIPENATEPALGWQEYVGLARPKERSKNGCEILNLAQAASPGHHHTKSAGIMCGEILVPIPVGYTALEIATISKTILKNEQIVALLNRKNPLAPSPPPPQVQIVDTSFSSKKSFLSSIQTIQEEDYYVPHEEDDDDEQEVARREGRRQRRHRHRCPHHNKKQHHSVTNNKSSFKRGESSDALLDKEEPLYLNSSFEESEEDKKKKHHHFSKMKKITGLFKRRPKWWLRSKQH